MRVLIPHRLRQFIRHLSHTRAIKRGVFGDGGDPFFNRLSEWVNPGGVVIDVGAAVGDYAIRLSRLVGVEGRVVALEPMPAQFELLVRNVEKAPYRNVTCLQLAAGESIEGIRMEVPRERGVPNWYMSRISETGKTYALCTTLDALPIPEGVQFIKVDTEGHDFSVLRGAELIIRRDHPTILLEDDSPEVSEWLDERGYTRAVEPRSVNTLYNPKVRDTVAR